MELKIPLYKYFKSAFQLSSIMQVSASVAGPYRPNRITDVARVWLQLLRPWQPRSEFIDMAIILSLPDETGGNSNDIFIGDTKLNIDIFNVLTNISISS